VRIDRVDDQQVGYLVEFSPSTAAMLTHLQCIFKLYNENNSWKLAQQMAAQRKWVLLSRVSSGGGQNVYTTNTFCTHSTHNFLIALFTHSFAAVKFTFLPCYNAKDRMLCS
jgi:hypothetical protein